MNSCRAISRRRPLTRSPTPPTRACGAAGEWTGRFIARVALRTVKDYLARNAGSLDLVRFVLFSPADYDVYAEALKELTGTC